MAYDLLEYAGEDLREWPLHARRAQLARLLEGVDPILVRLLGFGAVNWVAQWYEPDGPWTPEEIADAVWSYFGFGVIADRARKRR